MRKSINLLTKQDVIPWGEENLEGKLVVIKDTFFKPEFKDAKYQLVLATGGFGCEPISLGNAIFVKECHKDNPEEYRLERYNNDILGIATDEAIAEWKSIYGEFNDDVLKVVGGN